MSILVQLSEDYSEAVTYGSVIRIRILYIL